MVLGLFGIPLLMGVAVLITSRAWPGSNSRRAPEPDVPQQTKKVRTNIALASPGRVEPQAEVVSIGTGISGVVSSVVVREGQRVKVGQTLATLSCHEIEADLSAAAALLEAARQAQRRLLRGSTDDERSEIADRVSAARAAAREAGSRYERFAQLAAKDEIPLLDFDRVKLDMDTTNADLRALEHRQAIVNAPPLPGELARQEAETKAAEERQKWGCPEVCW